MVSQTVLIVYFAQIILLCCISPIHRYAGAAMYDLFATAMCKYSATGSRTRVARVRAEYPNQLDYSGFHEAPLYYAVLNEVMCDSLQKPLRSFGSHPLPALAQEMMVMRKSDSLAAAPMV